MGKADSKLHLLVLLVAISLAAIGLLAPKALAGDNNGLSGSSAANNCSTGNVRPSPYTGGAGIARVYYPADGSTVTVTTTGAVIKQSPCGTPYREGWVNPADICGLNSSDNLTGRLAGGSSNPYMNANGQNRTYDYSCGTGTSNNSSSSATTTTTAVQSAATRNNTTSTNTNTSAGKTATLPNTGPGDVLAVGGISAFFGTIGHFLYSRRFRRA